MKYIFFQVYSCIIPAIAGFFAPIRNFDENIIHRPIYYDQDRDHSLYARSLNSEPERASSGALLDPDIVRLRHLYAQGLPPIRTKPISGRSSPQSSGRSSSFKTAYSQRRSASDHTPFQLTEIKIDKDTPPETPGRKRKTQPSTPSPSPKGLQDIPELKEIKIERTPPETPTSVQVESPKAITPSQRSRQGTPRTANTSQRSRQGTPRTGNTSQKTHHQSHHGTPKSATTSHDILHEINPLYESNNPSDLKGLGAGPAFKGLKIETNPKDKPLPKSQSEMTLNAVKDTVAKAAETNPSSITVTGALVGSGIAAFGAGLGGNAIAATGGAIGTMAALGQAGMEWHRGYKDSKRLEEENKQKKKKKKKRKGRPKKQVGRGGGGGGGSGSGSGQPLLGKRSLGYEYDLVDALLMDRAVRLDSALRRRQVRKEYE